MKKISEYLKYSIEQVLNRMGLGIRSKLIIIFLVIKVIPIVILTVIAWRHFALIGDEVVQKTEELSEKASHAFVKTGEIAVQDAVKALDDRATEDIERMTTDTAQRVANFLYRRDYDILFAAKLSPRPDLYKDFIESRRGKLIKQGKWKLAPDGKSWIPEKQPEPQHIVKSSNRENDISFNYRPPDTFEYENRPLYLEITFIDLNGNEVVKVTSSPRVDPARKNVSDRRNTFVRAETYFEKLKDLAPGEIYVSDVIGAYTPSRYIGMLTPENAAKAQIEFEPEKEAYAGMENPLGKRFEGLVRWATPVVSGDDRIGYVTLALDHDHIMEFTDHTTPVSSRYTEIPSAFDGNYAFIWDYKCRSIVHPRHHSITGFNPETGEPEVPWLEESIYNAWQESGKSYMDFIKGQPTFHNQSVKKKPARELTRKGLVGLDGRYLNNAPQCTGWFDLTSEGGSGSFVILWSGLTKLTTAAAIPYYTGHYGESKRGFGFVAIGAGLDDFHRPARETEAVLDELMADTNLEISVAVGDTRRAITDNLVETTTNLLLTSAVMIILVIFIAIWMASAFTKSITKLVNGFTRFRSGERHFRFNAKVKDEMGMLADSFDDMADSLDASVTGPLVIADLDLKVRYMNDDGLNFLGKTLDDVLGTPYTSNSIFPKGSRFHPITALHEGREADVMFRPEAGRYVKGSASYLTDREGVRNGYLIVTSDVTDIVVEQKKIEEQKKLLDTIFASSPDLIWYTDANGRYLAVNPRFATISNLAPEDFRGKHPLDILPANLAEHFRVSDEQATKSDTPLYIEESITFADGHTETLDSVRTPIFDEEGRPAGLIGFARDVSSRVAIELELRSTQMELEQAVAVANRASEYKGEFLARMSHEIRTPMNAIIGMTNIVKRKLEELIGEDETGSSPKDQDLEKVQTDVRQIDVSSRHLLGLLNDILDISKIEAGKIELMEEDVDLRWLIDTVISIIKPRCDEKKIEFATHFDDRITTRAFITDSLRLRQVLINLLGNAVKFTPEFGLIEFRVDKCGKREGEVRVEFSVADNGIGISEEGQSLLFQPFEQAGRQISKNYGGSGLGLAISRNIVLLLGGDIRLTSAEGEGSTFAFDLWLKEAALPDAEEEILTDPARKFVGRRALLVDDVPINRIIVSDMLSTTGIDVDEAGDGAEAVKMFKNSPLNTYDIIYMDVQMPVMDGYEATSAIRAMDRPDARSVKIVALTANAFKEDIDKSLGYGMNAHLAKPLEVDKLLEVTFKMLGGS